MMLEFTVGKNIRQRVRAQSMKETTISIIDALRGLLAQKVWISDAPRPELSEIEAQVIEVKRLLAELEKNIQDQLQRGHAPRP
jgi:hypothetical protein